MKILLATDGSDHSKEMVKVFAGRAIAGNTKLRIITAFAGAAPLAREPHGVLTDYYTDSDRLTRKLSKSYTESAANILRKKHPALNITTAEIEGSPKEVILNEADAFGADLIVVGSHGYGAVAGFLLGSVSHAVTLHAKCSVEIVRMKKQKK
jgi:nucleotide-binding universal stress UspA family protein